jgi:hypothetical protein
LLPIGPKADEYQTVKYQLSQHAATRLRERKIETAWLEQAIASPQRTEPDPDDPGMEHRLAAIAETGVSCLSRRVRSPAKSVADRYAAF